MIRNRGSLHFLLVFLAALSASCKSPESRLLGHPDAEPWHPVPAVIDSAELFSCSIFQGRIFIRKKAKEIDELEIMRPGRTDSLVVIIDSPAIALKSAITPAEFRRQEVTEFKMRDLQGYSALAESPKPERIFEQRGEYLILGTSALESDDPRFVCRVDFDGGK